jgi:hypothetical protein
MPRSVAAVEALQSHHRADVLTDFGKEGSKWIT